MKTIFVSLLLICTFKTFSQTRLVDYVNPFIGTKGEGHTYPAATLPFGMIQVGPDNGSGSGWSTSYNYDDTVISGFSHTHLSGSGFGDLSDVSIIPVVNRQDTGRVFSSFAHKEERASPGFYGVRLRDFSIYAEMTTALRCALHRYAFPASNKSSIRFNLGFADSNTNKTTASNWHKVDDSTFTGYRFSNGWAKNQKVFFAVQLNKIPKSTTVFVDGKATDRITEVKGKDIIVYLNYDTKAGEAITMKVGISFADVEGAVESLNEMRTWDFALARRGAADLWERELRKVQINSTDKKLKQIFYTALYHTYLSPSIYSDRYGNYKGTKGDIKDGKMVLSNNFLWSTYRAQNPLLTITQTEMVPSLIKSFLAFYDQYGYLPVSDIHFNETNATTGYHSIPVIADAILKNLRGIDNEKAYAAMRRSAMQNIRGTESYRNFGFIPADRMAESVTSTLEYSFDDWCLAQVAKKLKKYADTAMFNKRAGYWRNIFDEKTGFFRGKNMSGKWVEPFDPTQVPAGNKNPYAEGDAWQHAFFVPHDMEGLQKSFASTDVFEHRLDSFLTGRPGLYEHGNELSQHASYIYSYLAKPWKSADHARAIMDKLYDNTPDGLTGRDDFGQLSAWYVFSALGFYPVNPASGEYVFGSPVVDQAILVLPSGMTFQLKVLNNSAENIYIQSITLNAKPYLKNYFTHHDLMVGGILEIKMGNKPNKEWGSQVENIPRSMSLVR